MTIISKLANIAAIKAQLKAAIRAKSVSISDTLPLSQYPAKIQEIPLAAVDNLELAYVDSGAGFVINVLTLKAPCSYIQDYAFQNCRFKRVIFPNTLRYIGSYSLNLNTLLEYIEIPSTVTNLGIAVFKGCTALVEAVCNQSDSTMNGEFFGGCVKLKKVTLGPSIKILASNVFNGCTLLESVNTEYIESLSVSCFAGCNAIVDLNFPSLTTLISSGTLVSIPNLENVNFGKVANFQFTNVLASCPKVKKLIFTDKSVGFVSSSFVTLAGLKYIEFNALGAMNIANNAFTGMTALAAIVFKTSTPPTIGGTTPFAGYPAAMKIYVPDAAVSAYKAATNWSVLAPYIYPMSEFVMPTL